MLRTVLCLTIGIAILAANVVDIVRTTLGTHGGGAIFSARRDAIVDPRTHMLPTAVGRLYFTAYTISTMGNGDFVPNGPAWQIATSIATISGVGTLTLTITFLLNVLPAVVQQRMLAAYISDLGGTPPRILERAEFVEPSNESPDPPSLDILRDLGVPTVDDEDFAREMRDTEESRRFFAGFLRDDGWPWSRLWEK